MTTMKRMTVSFPDDIVEQLEGLRRSEQFAGKPYSAIIRHFLTFGLEAERASSSGETTGSGETVHRPATVEAIAQ